MPTRTESQRTGDRAEGFVLAAIDGHSSWMGRRQDHDFGIDLEAELAPPVAEGQAPQGKLLKVQVKGSQDWSRSGGWIRLSLDREYLDYVAQFRIPVVLVAVDVSTGEAWYVWLQAWLLANETTLALAQTSSVTVKLDCRDTLIAGLDGPLERVALGQEPTAMVLALRDVSTAEQNQSSGAE
jgi:hypothetical protein